MKYSSFFTDSCKGGLVPKILSFQSLVSMTTLVIYLLCPNVEAGTGFLTRLSWAIFEAAALQLYKVQPVAKKVDDITCWLTFFIHMFCKSAKVSRI